MKNLLFILTLLVNILSFGQINGTIDNINEMYSKQTVQVVTKDGIHLATDIYLPVMQDCVLFDITLNGTTFPIQLIKKNTQYIIFDSTNITKENYRLPVVLTRTPYGKNGSGNGGDLFPVLGYAYAVQDMRGRYESEGVYFPMFSDSWQKFPYMPLNTVPMDLHPLSSSSNALYHSDGSEAINYINDSIYRFFDTDLDGVIDTFLLSNNNMGMFGASALGNSQYQAVSNMPFTANNPVKCLMPIVATNEHYNTTLFHNGVYRNMLASGWMRGQMWDIVDSLAPTDNSLTNTIHSPADYGYTDKHVLSEDLLDWFVANPINGTPSGAYPNSQNRLWFDASKCPIDNNAQDSPNGTVSRYKNLNTNIYHLTGWWDIFVDGQLETFNRTRTENPNSMQKIIIGPWTHQTIGSDTVGDMIYPQNVLDVLGIKDMENIGNNFLSDSSFFTELYQSEILNWFRYNLGGEPFFIIPESNDWQILDTVLVRVPSKNYVIPYYQFLNFIGGQGDLQNIPMEIDDGINISEITYSVPMQGSGLIQLNEPITPASVNFNASKPIRAYITGPTNDVQNQNIGNYWVGLDSLPFVNGINNTTYYLHQDLSFNQTPITSNEGDLFYVNDPTNPVRTCGGNNMIVSTPQNDRHSQGSMNYSDPTFAPTTMDRPDVLKFESPLLNDTLMILGFPTATIYAKANTSISSLNETDFDIFVRVLDVYPDGREMFITEGAVNARARNYAESIYNDNEDDNAVYSNPINDQFYELKFKMLPIGHVFGANHKIKILISSSNFPKYQSNPQVPLNANEFYRWEPGSSSTYTYQGTPLSPASSTITLNFNANQPNSITFPVVDSLPDYTSVNTIIKTNNTFKLYPNPTSNTASISFNKKVNTQIKIYSIDGKLVLTDNMVNVQTKTLDLSTLSKGVYIVVTDVAPNNNSLLIKE